MGHFLEVEEKEQAVVHIEIRLLETVLLNVLDEIFDVVESTFHLSYLHFTAETKIQENQTIRKL